MIMNDDMRDLIMKNGSRDDLREVARSFGMVSLRDAGMDAAYDGRTTLEEVIRETVLDA
jgi:type IV pilus assembly protein PilB